MKAISIQQPWSWAILHAGKDIENRNWTTSYRGEIAIHAPAKQQPVKRLPRGVPRPAETALHVNAIVGVVDLVDVVERSPSRWFHGPYGFVLANPRPLPKPVPCKGNLMLWSVPPSVARLVHQQCQPALNGRALAESEERVIAVRRLTVTQGNLNNNHLYLTPAKDLFPEESLGGPNEAQAAPRTVRVLWGHESVATDVVHRRNIFRRRAWVRQFFAANQVVAGDEVLLEQLGPYLYRVSKVDPR